MPNRNQPQYRYILFDLDNTLYPKEAGLMHVVGERILNFMIYKAGIPADDAALRRQEYYRKYGTSLRGLLQEHQIDPLEYLHFVHDINPQDFFGASPPLNRMLGVIPLRKVIFTNADLAHSRRVLQTLQVESHFESIFDIEAFKFQSKPDPLAYQHVLKTLNARGAECIMVEDSPRNLIPAKDLGMTTILVDSNTPSLAVDFAVPTVFHVEQILRQLMPDSFFG